MIVCCCEAVSDKKILNVIQEGACSVDDVTRRCGAGGDCGSCRRIIGEMILEHHGNQKDSLRGIERPDKRAA